MASSVNLEQIAGRLRAMPMARVVPVINILIVAWIAWIAATLSWRFFTDDEDPLMVAGLPEAPVSQVAAPTAVVSQREIARWHLFGQSATPGKAAPARAKKIPKTRLKLSLRGVISSDDVAGAWAIIAAPKGDELGYRIGDVLPGNATLEEIQPEQIVLLYNGRREVLRLEGGSPQKIRRNKPVNDRRAINFEKAGKKLQEYQDVLNKDPSELLRLVRPIPVKIAGKFVGFRLGLGKDRKALAAFGLQPGDLVMAVNGVSLDQASKGMDVLRNLKASSVLNLTIDRRGQVISRSFQLP